MQKTVLCFVSASIFPYRTYSKIAYTRFEGPSSEVYGHLNARFTHLRRDRVDQQKRAPLPVNDDDDTDMGKLLLPEFIEDFARTSRIV